MHTVNSLVNRKSPRPDGILAEVLNAFVKYPEDIQLLPKRGHFSETVKIQQLVLITRAKET